MEWKDIAEQVMKIVPGIGHVLGAVVPGAALAGDMVGIIGKAFGLGTDEVTPDAIAQKLQQDPEANLKLMVAENEYKLKIREQEIAELKVIIEDKQSARSMAIETTKATGKRDGNLYALAWLGILGYLALIVYLIGWGLPKMTPELALMLGNLIGIVGAKYSSIYDYFFGSSSGSREKNTLLATAKEKKAGD